MTARRQSRQRYLATVAALFAWAYLAWVLLTWTLTAEQLAFGAGIAAVTAITLAPLGRAVGPWWLLTPRRLLVVARLIAVVAVRVVVANVKLSARIWNPKRPLSSGMIVVATHERSDGGFAAV